ncbi:hypothetical protein L1049_024532 [Liquidambar formosana]|uniref:NB-ARC domain-containing protein n=1 Tax=Liquidambar formosana TaxID=63359 RepID=A0AAP0X1C1_LIQFO
MALDVLHFLREKFLDGLEAETGLEAERNGGDLPFQSIFLDIEKILKKMDMSDPNAHPQAKELLYDLNGTLAECQLIKEKRPLRLQKMDRFGCHSIKQFLLNKVVKRKLLSILKSLSSSNDRVASSSLTHRRSSSISMNNINPRHGFDPQIDFMNNINPRRGFDPQIDDIKKRLLDRNSNARSGMRGIGIVGTGGSGKTTLASMVFNSKEVREQFSVMIPSNLDRTSQSQKEGNRMSIFMDILRGGKQTYLTFERMLKKLEEEPDDYLLDKYILQFQRFLLGKRYIILLDDVWDTSLWYGESLQPPLDPGGRPYILSREWLDKTGGTIMVTSRLEEVAKRVVGEKNLRRIQPISREDCWSIFRDAVKREETVNPDDDPMILTMKEEIKDQCDGLPLAAHTLAEIIRDQIKRGQQGTQE